MARPTFSVIIPAYNAAATLRSTVDSVLDQTDPDFEIIIINDGSSDETFHIMLDIAGEDSRIRIASQPNAGVSATRNFGASIAEGHLLAFLDADDRWATDKLAQHRLYHSQGVTIQATFARVTFCPVQDGQMILGQTESRIPDGYLEMADVVVENAVCTTSNLVIDAKTFAELGGFDENMRYAEDQEFLSRVIAAGGLIHGIPHSLVYYRLSADGLSCDFSAMHAGWRGFAEQRMSGQALAKAEATYCRYLTRRALRAGARMNVTRSLARSGLAADRHAFMSDGLRSKLTLCGAIFGGVIPAPMRRSVFA